MDDLLPSIPRVAAQAESGETDFLSPLIGAAAGAGLGFVGGGGPVGAVVGGIMGAAGGMGWLDFLGRPTRTLLHTGDPEQAWASVWDSSKAATEADLLADIGIEPMDQGEGFDLGDVGDFMARMVVGMGTDPLTYLNPGAMTAKGALRKTMGHGTLQKYYKQMNTIRANGKTLGWSEREIEKALGTAANRIADEHNLKAVAEELRRGLPKGTLNQIEKPYVMELVDGLNGTKVEKWKQVSTIEDQLSNFGLGKTFADRVRNGEQWTIGFGLPFGHTKDLGIQTEKIVDFLSAKGSNLEAAIGATAPGRWANNKIRTVREYIFNPIREDALEELKRQSTNLPWVLLRQIEQKHGALFNEIKGMKLNSDEYAALTQLASWERLANAGENTFAQAKAAEARAVFTDPARAAQASGVATKIRDIEDDLLLALQEGGAEVQDIRDEVMKQHAAFQSDAERLQAQYLQTRGARQAAMADVDQAAAKLDLQAKDEAVRYNNEVVAHEDAVKLQEREAEAEKTFNQAIDAYARDGKFTPEEVAQRRADASTAVRRAAREWQALTGSTDLNDFYINRMPTDPDELAEWAKIPKVGETPGTPVSAAAAGEPVASTSPGVPGKRFSVQKHASGVTTYIDEKSVRHWSKDGIDIPESSHQLTERQQAVEDRWNHEVLNNLDKYVNRYIEKDGVKNGVLTIDTDKLREYSKDYSAKPEARAEFAAAVHEGSSTLNKAIWKKVLDDPKYGNNVGFTFGGGGSGKSGAVEYLQDHYGVKLVLDGTGANMPSTKARIEQALAAKKKVEIAYVHRPVEGAVEGMLDRAAKKDTGGRVLILDQLAGDHVKAQANIIELANDETLFSKGADIVLLANTGKKGDPMLKMSVADLEKVRYTSSGEVENVAHRSANEYIERRKTSGDPIPEWIIREIRLRKPGGAGVSAGAPGVAEGAAAGAKVAEGQSRAAGVAGSQAHVAGNEAVRGGPASEPRAGDSGGLRLKVDKVKLKDATPEAQGTILMLQQAKSQQDIADAIPTGTKKDVATAREVADILGIKLPSGKPGEQLKQALNKLAGGEKAVKTVKGGIPLKPAGIAEAGAKPGPGEIKKVAPAPAPQPVTVDRRVIARRLFKSLPAEKQAEIFDRIEAANPRSGLTREQIVSQDQAALNAWEARKPTPDQKAYDAWLAREPKAKFGANEWQTKREREAWEREMPADNTAQWAKEKPEPSLPNGEVNRETFNRFESYLDDTDAKARAEAMAAMDPKAKRQHQMDALDRTRTLDAIAADPEIAGAVDRIISKADQAAPVPRKTQVYLEKPERKQIVEVEGVGDVKQPWMMTADEWTAHVRETKGTDFTPTSRIVDEHVRQIKNAVARGEYVPPKVLASYPEIAAFQPPTMQYIGTRAGGKEYKLSDAGNVFTANLANARKIALKDAQSATDYAAYLDSQVKLLEKTRVLGEKATALEAAKKTAAHFKNDILDKTPEHLHAMLTPDALNDLVQSKTFAKMAGSSKGILRKIMQVGRTLTPVEVNQVVREEERAGMLLAQGGRNPKGTLSFGELLAAINPDDTTYEMWAKHSLPKYATPKQIAAKTAELKALPTAKRIERVREAYAKFFEEKPEVALAASIENAAKLISNASFNDGLKNLFTRKAPRIPLPEAEMAEAKAHNEVIRQQKKSSNDRLSEIGRKLNRARVEGRTDDIAQLVAERKQVKADKKLLSGEPLGKTGLSAPSASGERWVSAEGLGPQFKGREMKEGVYNQALKYLEMKNAPMAFQGLMEMMRTPTRWFKELQLTWPGAILRDMMGNKLLRIQHEGTSAQTVADSAKILKVVTSGGDTKKLADISFTFPNWERSGLSRTVSGKEMWDHLAANGISGVDQYSIEVGRQIRGGPGKIRAAIGKVRTFVQDLDRAEMFHARLVHGDAVGEAAARTNLALYDYRSVSPFVDMMRTSGIMPFATWTAKNIPAQFELFIRHPGQFAALMHAKAAVEQGVPGVSDKDLPSYLDNRFNVILGKTADGKVVFRTLDGVVPMADLPQLGPQGVSGFLQQALGPVPKLVLEQMSNRDSFSGKMIEKYDGELSPLVEDAPGLSNVLIPVRAKRAMKVAIGRPLTISEEMSGWLGDKAEGPLSRPKPFMERTGLVSAFLGIGPQQTDPRVNAINRKREKDAEVNRALSDAAHYRKRGQFRAAEAAQRRAMELQKAR